jgi:hypothetical protein
MRLIPARMRFLKRLNLKRRLNGRAEPGPPAPFVVGATRSGTTMLRLMLDAHPDVAIPSETHFIHKLVKTCERWRVTPDMLADVIVEHKRWGDFHLDPDELRRRFRSMEPLNMADALRTFYTLYAEREGKSRWGDKTPGYVRYMRRIHWILPEARFLHLIRDGRDVAVSVLPMNWGPESVREAAELWVERVTIGREQGPVVPYMEVRFEDLVLDTEPTLRRVCEFLELPWEPVMLDYHERAEQRLMEKARDLPRHKEGRPPQPAEARLASHAMAMEPPNPDRIGRWRTDMSAGDRDAYEEVAGELLAELGYETGATSPRPPAGTHPPSPPARGDTAAGVR